MKDLEKKYEQEIKFLEMRHKERLKNIKRAEILGYCLIGLILSFPVILFLFK